MSLLIVFCGLLAFTKLPIREYPDIDPPIVTITTVYPGANSKVIESEITDLLESEISGIEGLRSVVSSSRDQVSIIVAEFKLNRDINNAAQDIRDKISRVRAKLPISSKEPVIAKADADAQPIMWIAVKSKKRSLIELSDYAERELKDYFQNIDGVSKVILGGERRRAIQVLVDPKKLAYYGLSIIDIESSLKTNNIELPAGSIVSPSKEFSINFDAKLRDTKAYSQIIIRRSRYGAIKLADVAQIVEGAENDQSFVRFNGQQGLGLGIIRQSKSNTVKISDQVKLLIKDLKTKLPSDIELVIGYDAAQFIKLSLEELYSTILFSTILVLLVIYAFLGNIRSTLIPAIAIPISLVGVMFGLQLCNFSINLMTLLGLIVAIGIVVDDSIIVLENVYRYLEEGMEPELAARKGTEEITLAVIATTLVLVSIFLPIGFMSGIVGRLLSEFAFALCFATLISAFVSLTLAPMLCAKIIQAKNSNSKILWLERIINQIQIYYSQLLQSAIKYKKNLILLGVFGSLLGIIICFALLPRDFLPDEDRGNFLVVFKSPRASNLDVLDRQMRKVEKILADIPELATSISVGAFGRDAPGKLTEGVMIARLKDWSDRKRKVFGIVGPLYPQFAQMPEVFTLPILPKSGPDSGFGSQPIQLVLKTNDLDFLSRFSIQVVEESKKLSTIMFARSNLSLDKPELSVHVDRDKALALGVSPLEISRSLELLFAGSDVSEFNQGGENYKVQVQVPKTERDNLQKIGEFAIRNNSGRLVQLSNLIRVDRSIGAEEINHHNRKKSATIEASPGLGSTPSRGLDDLEKLVRKLISKDKNLPRDFEIDYLGTSKETKDSDLALYFGFVIALLFAYLFLAAQFESFTSPLVIMLTVPLALFGALLGLLLFQVFPFVTQSLIAFGAPSWIQYVIPQFKNISINVYSQIGMIMLIGMATKNGILLVEFINKQLELGVEIREAVITAARLRLRPILMTSLSTILGVLPIALAMGVGTESRQSLGLAIVFGMGLSTILTLFVIPCFYLWVYEFKRSRLTAN